MQQVIRMHLATRRSPHGNVLPVDDLELFLDLRRGLYGRDWRDAIRDSEGNHMVQYAAILYPGPPLAYHEGIEALPAYPGSAPLLEQRLREILRSALTATAPPIP